MLSYRGETAELSDLITYAKRFSIPLIGMASNPNSTLLQAADVPLRIPRAKEACPNGLAPTTSTTLMLVLGDALAVALMERKGFSADQYRNFHPGGSLGRMLIRVSDLMRREDLPVVALQTPMGEVLATLSKGTLGCVVVVDEAGGAAGIITHGDVGRHIAPDFLDRTRARGDDLQPPLRAARSAGRRSTRAHERKKDHPASGARSGRCRENAAGNPAHSRLLARGASIDARAAAWTGRAGSTSGS